MELQVTITLSDRLFGLLEDKLPNLGAYVKKTGDTISGQLMAQAKKEYLSAVNVAETAKVPDVTTTAPAEVSATEEPHAPAMPVEEMAQQPDKPLTEEDIRACMHRTRQRFEGEDYKDNTDSEAYKKYHKPLTSMFKQIAVVLGADKPSALPAEMRAAFIAECDALIIDEKGFIAPPPAPF